MATARPVIACAVILLAKQKIVLALVVALALTGVVMWLILSRPKPPPPPPPAPPKWECGTAYGEEVCERQLPPARKAAP